MRRSPALPNGVLYFRQPDRSGNDSYLFHVQPFISGLNVTPEEPLLPLKVYGV